MPQALPYLSKTIEKYGAQPIIVDLEENGWSLSRLIEEINDLSPDVILISSTTPSFCFCKAISKEVKALSKKLPIIYGGPHATYEWESILENGIADIIVIGEGELILPQVLDHFVNGKELRECHGIAFRSETGKLIYNSRQSQAVDADQLEIPSYRNINLDAYRKRVGKCTIEVVRGCPHGCRFCLNTKFYSSIKYKPIKEVIKEIRFLVDEYHFDKFSIISPEFVANPDYTKALCTALASLLYGTNITWACATTANSLTKDILHLMAKAHCRSIFIGIDTGDTNVQSIVGKQFEEPKMEQQLVMIRDSGIDILSSFIIGFPGETVESASQTISLADKLKDKFNFRRIQFNTFGPFPGTDLRESAHRYGARILPIDFAFYAIVPAVESDHFSREKHHELWHEVWKRFFPEYYKNYLEIEQDALGGRNPLLERFCGGKMEQ